MDCQTSERIFSSHRQRLVRPLSPIATLLAIAFVAVAAPTAHAGRHIDTFDYGQFTWNEDPGETATFTPNENIDLPGILGGKRTVTITNNPDSAGEINVRLIVDDEDFQPGEVPLSFDLGTANSGSLELSYENFEERDFINIPDANAQWDGVVIDFEGVFPLTNEGTVSVTLISGDGEQATVSKPAISFGQLIFPYTDFLGANAAFTTASLLDVDGARLRIDAVAGDGYRLDFFGRGGFVTNPPTVIPLPSALLAAPAMMAVAGVAYRKMRRGG